MRLEQNNFTITHIRSIMHEHIQFFATKYITPFPAGGSRSKPAHTASWLVGGGGEVSANCG